MRRGALRIAPMVDRLPERLDRLQRLGPARALPVLPELPPTLECPLDDKPLGLWREVASEDLEALNVDGRLIVTVGGVEVRASAMVHLVVVHPNDDPVEGADSWHRRRILATGAVASRGARVRSA